MSEALVDDRSAFLAGVPLFAGIPVNELVEIARVLVAVKLEPGDVLFRQGEEADGLHVLERGLVQAARRGRAGVRAARAGRRSRRDPASRRRPALGHRTGRSSRRRRCCSPGRTSRRSSRGCTRRPSRLAKLLGGGTPQAGAGEGLRDVEPEDLPEGRLPDPAYVFRLQFFRSYGQTEFGELVESSRLAVVSAGQAILDEGAPQTRAT
jgi:hypothetical protein